MTQIDRFIGLPERLRSWHKWLIALGLYAAATGLRAVILPADGRFLFDSCYPALIVVYVLCGRWLGRAFVVASMTTALLLFTTPGKADAAPLVTGYLLSLIAGGVIGESFRVLVDAAAGHRARRSRCQGIVESQLAPLSPDNPVFDLENRGCNACGESTWEPSGELADLYQNAPCAYYSIDARGVILKANARLLEWLGAPAEDVVGKARLPDFFDEEGKRRFAQDFPRFMETGRLTDTEHTLVSRDGKVRRVSISANGQFDARHRFLQSRSIMVDITERTADLTRAHRELETFSYSVSHDLRAPLRAVNGLAAIILEDHVAALPAECITLVERIRDAGQRMGLLVDVLLSLSRLELGRIPDRPVEHEPLVRDIYAELQSLDRASPATLVVQPLQPCRAQPELLRQVWQNLLSNAMKHSCHRPDARIEVGSDTSGPVPVYYVRDNGEGFDMRYAGKLFQMFERLQADGSREGNGVGLAIVRRIVERHGGRVWAESAPGEGATFYFTLTPEASAT